MMRKIKKDLSPFLIFALVIASLVLDFGQLNANAYDNYTGTGVFRVDIVIGVNDCANNTRGTESKFQLKLLDAGGGVVSQTPVDALNGAAGAGDGGTNPLESSATTSFTFNGADYGDVNETVAGLGTLAVSKAITQVQLVCTSAADDWLFNNVIVYYSPDGGSAWTTLADNGWQASSGTVTWSAGTYFTSNYKTLGFNPNGGTGGGTYDAIPGQTIPVPSAPVKTGYTFIGWLGAPARMPAAPTTYFAGWSVNSYIITFDSNGGSAVSPITNNYGVAVTPPSNPTRTGYTFAGWEPAVPATIPAGNITCVAQWNINSYTVSFDSAGGSAVAAFTQDYGTDIIAPGNPERTGYTFTGWLPAVPAVMPASNTNCVAQWVVNSYTIIFDSNGGTAVSPITQGYGTAVTSPANIARAGYTFSGWLPVVPETMPAENLTCTAQWDIDTYTITFNANGGTTTVPITQDYGSAVSAPADPSRPGYTFAGWLPAVPAIMPAGNTICVAQWSINSYTITFDPAGGIGGGAVTQDYGTAVAEPADPVREGYTFTGWLPLVPDAMPAEDLTCVAQWIVNSYTIAFDADGGSAVSPITQFYGTDIAPPASPAKAGYTFAGWLPVAPATMPAKNMTCVAQWIVNSYTIIFDLGYDEIIYSTMGFYGSAITAPEPYRPGYTLTGWIPAVPATMPDYDIVCVAQWSINSYTITFDTRGGSVIPAVTQAYGSAVTEPVNPTRAGYAFAGWQPAVPAIMPAGDITCVAQWVIPFYTITWDANGGSGGGQNTCRSGDDPEPIDPGTKLGYLFAGWSPIIMPAYSDAVYIAQWVADTRTIFFDSAGGSAVASITQMIGTPVTSPPDPVRTGYTFMGWSASVPAVMPGEDITCTAQWTINSYTITFDAGLGTGGAIQILNFGVMPVPPVVTRLNYRFDGWSPAIEAVTGNAIYSARWIRLGDLNSSGSISSLDALLTLQYAAGLITLTPEQLLQADVDQNGFVNNIDALKILQLASGMIINF